MRDNRRWLPTPVVANGLMYVPEGSGRVVAFDAVSGDVVWIHERRFPDDVAMSEAFPRHRGVSILDDTIYWGTADSHLVALDARTGQLRWEVKTGDYHLGEGHSHPPLIADGKVFLPQAGGDLGARGQFRAFDARTGRLLWSIYTAPGPEDEPAFNTWARRDVPAARRRALVHGELRPRAASGVLLDGAAGAVVDRTARPRRRALCQHRAGRRGRRPARSAGTSR